MTPETLAVRDETAVMGLSGLDARFFLSWMDNPSTVTGIRTLTPGDWRFRSYADIAGRARALADSIADGERLAVLSEDAPTVLATFGAAWLRGGAAHVLPQPVAYRHRDRYADQVGYMLARTGARRVVVGPDAAAVAGRLPVPVVPLDWSGPPPGPAGGPLPDPDPEDVVLQQFTSGSTGRPKLIEVSAGNLVANLVAMRHWLRWRDGVDAWSSWLPLHHDMGLVGALFVPAAHRSNLWSMPPGRFLRQPAAWLAALSAGATVTAAPPFGYGYAVDRVGDLPAGTDLSGWRVACIAAEVVTEDVLAAFADRFGPYGFTDQAWCPAYGLAEATLCVTTVSAHEPVRIARLGPDATLRPGGPVHAVALDDVGTRTVHDGRSLVGCGRPVLGTAVDVLDEAGAPVPDGHFGELAIRGASVAAVGGAAGPQAERVHRTGDGGVRLDGELFVVGRLGDGVKVRGEFVDCEGLERRLADALGLASDRAALALGQLGPDLHAVLLVRAPAPEPAAVRHAEAVARAVLGAHARLAIRPVAAGRIPRTSSGKVRRREIWRRWQLVSEVEGGEDADGGRDRD
jgi:acyl-CoA synthetase (AMP-forming)/AMP-acid ligase II